MDAPAFTYLGSGLATRLHTCTEIVNTLNTFLPVGNRLLRHLPNTKRSSDLLKNMSHDHAINICTHTITVSPTNAPPASLEAGHSSWKEENLPPTFPTQTAALKPSRPYPPSPTQIRTSYQRNSQNNQRSEDDLKPPSSKTIFPNTSRGSDRRLSSTVPSTLHNAIAKTPIRRFDGVVRYGNSGILNMEIRQIKNSRIYFIPTAMASCPNASISSCP